MNNISGFSEQPLNLNFLSPFGFQVVFQKLPYLEAFVQRARIPPVIMEAIPIRYPSGIMREPGSNLQFGQGLQFTFKIDEDFTIYKQIFNWMCGLGTPESSEQNAALLASGNPTPNDARFSDVSLIILNGVKQPSFSVDFKNVFPTGIGEVQFGTDDQELAYITCAVDCTYSRFDINPII